MTTASRPPAPPPPPGAGRPTPPISLGTAAPANRIRSRGAIEQLDDALLDRLGAVCAVSVDESERREAGRDWWPLAMTWALHGGVGHAPAAVARPTDVDEVAAVLAICDEARTPVTAAAGRSGVLGGSVPLFGGVTLDMCGLAGIADVDVDSMVLDVGAGTFGDVLEHELQATHGVTIGHWPQSIALSTVGGWLACRSAGQMSNRYGKIEDMVQGLTVVLADGTVVRTGGSPRAAAGPDLNQVFVGSEGTLGVICDARLRLHPAPETQRVSAWAFGDFATGMDACRRVVQRGATPAVLRLYDDFESNRHFDTSGVAVLLALDEGDDVIISAAMGVVDTECTAAGAERLDDALVDHWLDGRNDVSALEALVRKDYVVDTMEVSAPWRHLDAIHRDVTTAIMGVDGALVASVHQSHAYTDGACLYFTFAGQPDPADKDRFYLACWDAGTRAVLDGGGALSHHHGVGLNRSRFMDQALGSATAVLAALKVALDPNGILNPGKLGLASPYGDPAWP